MNRVLFLLIIVITPLVISGQEKAPEKPDGYWCSTTLKIAYALGTLDLIEKKFPVPDDIKEYKDIVYKQIDSTDLKLDIYHSKDITESAPLLIFFHGGGWKKGNKRDYLIYLVEFARRGYVTATVQYRFVDKAKYPAQILDVKSAIKWLKTHGEEYHIDTEQIAVIGGSAGGHLAMFAGYTSNVPKFNEVDDSLGLYKVQAVVDLYGPADLTTEYAREHKLIKGFIGKSYAEVPDIYAEASPITYITEDDPPTLIFQGTIDDLVPVSQSDNLNKKLEKTGVDVEYHRLDGWPHAMDLSVEVNNYCKYYMGKFFEKYLPIKKMEEVKTNKTLETIKYISIDENWIKSGDVKTWGEKLGFPSDKKVIILHIDDMGMSPEANEASINYLENKEIQSAAIMVPCPNADEAINWAVENPSADIGLHLTLTSEWKTYRWGGVLDSAEIPGLIDEQGKLWKDVPEVVVSATPEEVEKEIRAQIERAISLGMKPGHIDTHMGTLYGHKDYMEVYIKVAMEYDIPAMVIDVSREEIAKKFRDQGYPINDEMINAIKNYTLPQLDDFYAVPKGKTYEEIRSKFFDMLNGMKPGLNEVIFHPAIYSENLKTITGSWQQRNWEAELFSDPIVIEFCKNKEFVFTNWKEIKARWDSR